MSQPLLGVLMLDSRFPRIAGDVGNPHSFDFPIRYQIVKGAKPRDIVCADAGGFLPDFIAAGHQLVDKGCSGIATTCGFLSPMRGQLADALGVPVASSSLEQAPMIAALLPAGQRVGILTISANALTAAHLNTARVPKETPIIGVENSHFGDCILGNKAALDVEKSRAELVAAARDLIADHPDIGAILLECTNMPPYAADIATATGKPVFSILTYLNWFHASLAPPRF